jgi:hypothetical protein
LLLRVDHGTAGVDCRVTGARIESLFAPFPIGYRERERERERERKACPLRTY